MSDAYQRHVFNWLPMQNGEPGDGYGLKKLKNVQIEATDDLGLLWNCVMLDRVTVQIHLTWDNALLRQVEVKGMLDEILRIVGSLARKENWCKSLGEVVPDVGLGNWK